MPNAIDTLLSILDLEPLGDNRFRGSSPDDGWRRVFGGQVIAQALVAAVRTVDGRTPHSLHAYFILPGDPSLPIVYAVELTRDGRSFSTRRVVALQSERPIFSMSVSFQVEEKGFEHQLAMPAVPPPEDLPDRTEIKGLLANDATDPIRHYWERDRPIELRPIDLRHYVSDEPLEPVQRIWFRARHALPDDPDLHRCILSYASDMTILDTALFAHGSSVFDRAVQAASLDHALWFHRPSRVDEWLLYSEDSPSASGARGFARGSIFARDGTLVASVAQEGLIRPRNAN
jgi:acyl-CoA thioesterase II